MKKHNEDGSLSKEFLISRGYCCSNNCKNCPYFPRNVKGSSELFEEPTKIERLSSCPFEKMQNGECICYLNDKV